MYYHSPKHFYKSLYNNNLFNNNFYIGRYHKFGKKLFYFDKLYTVDSVLFNYPLKGFKEILLKKKLSIKHLNISDSDWFGHIKPIAKEFSHLKQLYGSKIIISSNGDHEDSNLIEYSGYFTFYRFSGKLPTNYEPNKMFLKEIINNNR